MSVEAIDTSRAVRLALSKIRRDGGTQPRAELNEEWAGDIAERMADGAEFLPVTVYQDGTDLWLADGFHRCRGADIAGIEYIAAYVVTGTRQDARDYANSGAPNGRHGLRESKQDRWRRIENMLRDHPDWTLMQVGEHCEVSHMTVKRVRESIFNNVKDTDERTVTRNGTTYTMNTGNIGKREEDESALLTSAEQEGPFSFATDSYEELEEASSETPEKHVHVSANSGNNEWYTPPQYIELAREAMGGIDTDPASNEFANQNVKAATYYTAETDGRDKPWKGNVWLNPPYAQPLMSEFSEAATSKRLEKEFDQACILVNNATETAWFQRMMDAADAVCFIRGRVRYLDSQGNPANTPLQGQAIIYMGDRVERFKDVFSNCGRVLVNG